MAGLEVFESWIGDVITLEVDYAITGLGNKVKYNNVTNRVILDSIQSIMALGKQSKVVILSKESPNVRSSSYIVNHKRDDIIAAINKYFAEKAATP